MRTLTAAEDGALRHVARELGVEPVLLAALIEFESRWNPQAKNPRSSARGLIQFMDATARGMGYDGSDDLIASHPDTVSQLRCCVRDYLAPQRPFRDEPPALPGQSLFLAVFYPAARRWHPDRKFSARVRAANPGIVTVRDYVDHVMRRAGRIRLAEASEE